MENLNVEIKTGGAYGTHIFIGCDIYLEMEIAGKIYSGSFQTGHSYDHQDYGYPSNDVSVYDDNDLLEALDNSCGEYEDFLEMSDVNISEKEFDAAYETLTSLRDAAQQEVNEVLQAEETKLEKDNHNYVCVTERDKEDNQDSPAYSCRFANYSDAWDFIEEMQNAGNLAHEVNTSEGVALCNNHYSNFQV